MEELLVANQGQDSHSFWYLVRKFDANGWQQSAFVRNAKEQKIEKDRIKVPVAVVQALDWKY